MARRQIKQERAHETRARILEGAAASFAENGFAGATISDILKRSGVTKGALYFHFDTKEEVADAVLAAHGAWMEGVAREVPGDGLQRLVNLSYVVCDGLVHEVLFRATARLAIERETYGHGRPEAFGMWETMTKAVIDRLIARREIIEHIDSELLARMLSGAMLGMHLSSRAGGDERGLHDEVAYFWRSVGPTLVPPGHTERVDFGPPAAAAWAHG